MILNKYFITVNFVKVLSHVIRDIAIMEDVKNSPQQRHLLNKIHRFLFKKIFRVKVTKIKSKMCLN